MDKPKTAPVIHERPKMPRATWEALRNHIIKERKRKQEEEEKSEEYERLKKERENRKKQEATTLEETKDQIAELEKKLTSLKEEKHQLFLTLKKVLNEDDTRRRKETDEMGVIYGGSHSNQVQPIAGHTPPQQVYMNPQPRQTNMYMKSPHMNSLPQVASAQAPGKRARSPSPIRGGSLAAVSSAYYRPSINTGRLATSSIYGNPSVTSSGPPIYAVSNSSNAYPYVTQANTRVDDERKVYLANPSRFIQHLEAQPKPGYHQDRDRGRISLGSAPSAHSQPVALAPGRNPGSIPPGYPLRNTGAYATTVASSLISTGSPSVPPRTPYTQAAAQLQATRYYQGIREN